MNGFSEKKYFKNRTFHQRIYKFQKIIFPENKVINFKISYNLFREISLVVKFPYLCT